MHVYKVKEVMEKRLILLGAPVNMIENKLIPIVTA